MLPRGLQVIARLDGNSNAVAADGRPRGRVAASIVGDQFPQTLQSGICEGGRHFALASPVEPETAVFGLHVECKVPQWLLSSWKN
jgi:hypothetical protein